MTFAHNLVNILLDKNLDHVSINPDLRIKNFAIATYESVKIVIIIGSLFLVSLMLSSKVSKITHSFTLNESLFFPR